MFALLAEMLRHEFMRNAFMAGTAVAVACGLAGSFILLRGQLFAGDALSHVAFTGTLAALLLGIDVRVGLYGGTVLVAALLAALGPRARADDVAIGSVRQVTPQEMVDLARRTQAAVVVSSYNEPLITSEWAVAIFRAARAASLLPELIASSTLRMKPLTRVLRAVLMAVRLAVVRTRLREEAILGIGNLVFWPERGGHIPPSRGQVNKSGPL